MKRKKQISATDLAACCVCEQRVVFDWARGKRRTPESRREMEAGVRVHASLHQAATRAHGTAFPDSRCFVATALWGHDDARTAQLRQWRDRWLLKRAWGPWVVELYYKASPGFVQLMSKVPLVRIGIHLFLSAFLRIIDAGRR